MNWINKAETNPDSVCAVHCPVQCQRGCGTAGRGGDTCLNKNNPCPTHSKCGSEHYCGVYIYGQDINK